MSSLIAKNLQVGSDPTATNNFTIFQPATPDGTLRIGNGNTGITASLLTINSAGAITQTAATANGVMFANGSKVLTTGSALTFDGSNLGLNVTPSAWASGNRFIDINASASYGAFGSSDSMMLANAYWNGSNWIRKNANNAWRMVMESASGAPAWTFQYAGNSTAGSTISWSEAMRIDSSGNVSIGTSSPGAKLHVFGANTTSNNYTNNDAAGGALLLQDQGGLAGNGGQILFAASQGIFAGIKGLITNGTGPAGDLVFQTRATTGNVNERARIDSSGNLLVGTTSNANSARLNVQGTSGAHPVNVRSGNSSGSAITMIAFYDGASEFCGQITIDAGANTTQYNTSSDYRLKNITGPITTSGAYIDSLNPVEGTWKADGSTFVGLIAHEVQEASRTPVTTGTKDGEQMQGMDYSSAEIIANMLAELKSLRARVAQLEAK